MSLRPHGRVNVLYVKLILGQAQAEIGVLDGEVVRKINLKWGDHNKFPLEWESMLAGELDYVKSVGLSRNPFLK